MGQKCRLYVQDENIPLETRSKNAYVNCSNAKLSKGKKSQYYVKNHTCETTQ